MKNKYDIEQLSEIFNITAGSAAESFVYATSSTELKKAFEDYFPGVKTMLLPKDVLPPQEQEQILIIPVEDSKPIKIVYTGET